MMKESEKHILWKEKFGVFLTTPLGEKIFQDIWEQVLLPEERIEFQNQIKIKENLNFITKIDGDKNDIELRKRTEEFRNDSYSLKEVQEKVSGLTPQDIDMVCNVEDETYYAIVMYALMIGRDCGLEDEQIKIIIESLNISQAQPEIEGYTKEENDIIKNLSGLQYAYNLDKMIDFWESSSENKMSQNDTSFGLQSKTFEYVQDLPQEKQKDFILMAKVLNDAFCLGNMVVTKQGKSIEQELFLEESMKYLPTAFQIQEAFANKWIDEIITKEGFEDKKEYIKEKLAQKYNGKSPVEYAYKLSQFVEKKKMVLR